MRSTTPVRRWMALAALSLAVSIDCLSGTPPTSQQISFARDIAPVLQDRCSDCHLTGEEAPGGLALHAAAAYASIVNVQSKESHWLRIEPGHPERSYLMMKLDGTHLDSGGIGARMPFGRAPVDQSTRDLIRAWIAQGAPNN